MSRRAFAAVLALACTGGATGVRAQSAADLSPRITIDGQSAEFSATEAAFRNADICGALVPPVVCTTDEEPGGDSAWSAIQDVRQIHVTWDANNLYIAVDATLGGQALWVGLDWLPGGLEALGSLEVWRRALHFGSRYRPDAFLVVGDAQAVPELYRADGPLTAVAVPASQYRAAASFDADAPGRALEAAIPWTLLFPNAPQTTNPEPGAPLAPMFVLPPEASRNGLRLAAVIVHARDGYGGGDTAPDNLSGVALDPSQPLIVDRAVHVVWDANPAGAPHFVDFGASLQTQTAPRFDPTPPAPAVVLKLLNLRSFSDTTPTRLVLADAGRDLSFTFDVEPANTSLIYVSASIVSQRGQHVRELYRDAQRNAAVRPPPFAPFSDPNLDRWDGRDDGGSPVAGGIYVLRLEAGLSPGSAAVELRRAITVVR